MTTLTTAAKETIEVKAHFTITIEFLSITKRAQMLFLAGNILCEI